jgi:tetratricopeptide (TPR) repeat protein
VRNDRRSAEDERIEAELQMLMATLYAMRGEYGPARFHFENGLAAQESIDDLYGCARSHINLGYLAQLQSDYTLAVRHYAQAETLARKVQTKYMLSAVLLNASYAYFRLDRYDDSEGACHDALLLCEEMREQDGMAKAYDLLGLIAYNRGDYPAAIAQHERAYMLHEQIGSAHQRAYCLALLVQAHTAHGQIARARTLAIDALASARQIQAPQLETEVLNASAGALLAAAKHENGDATLLAEAYAMAAQAATLAEGLGARVDYCVARRLQGESAAARGEPFVEHFAAARRVAEALGASFELARVDARHGAALAARNDPQASAYLKRAAETFRQIGAQGELRRMGNSNERSS